MKYARHLKLEKPPRRFPLVLYITFCTVFHLVLAFVDKNPQVNGNDIILPENPPAPEVPISYHETISKGTTLSDILTQCGFSAADIHQMREEVKPVYDLSEVRAGNEIRIIKSPNGDVSSLEYTIDDEKYLLVKNEKGQYSGQLKIIPYETFMTALNGFVTDNLISSVTQQKEGEYLALTLAEIFSWDIDFYTDLREGDRFQILFEKKHLNGEFYGYGKILAASFTNQGQTYWAFRYNYPDGSDWDYFDAQGRSLRKEFLKSPIKFARITSRFSLRRLHPIRKVYRPHYGVDYGARIGTPVQATADGTVIFVGRHGASGRMVSIRHRNDYVTQYLHLRGYPPGIKKGARIKGGQVIGYVGASGEATGPHLDYRIKFHGKYINPLAWKFKPVKPVPPEYRKDFLNKAGAYFFWLRAAGRFL
ncbi:MAG: peptidoglycan DD-metalloendopeptidase family protein [Candidatus Aminicenantes bacterium]|nr:peptidoglycan DD-metalloendopeptidase family protein [Candidatus Aminicenantes bacterium]